jgi:hypothetical protein
LRRGLGGCGLIGINRNESRRSTEHREDQGHADRPEEVSMHRGHSISFQLSAVSSQL